MGLGTQPYGKLLDYEQYIDHQLERTRTHIKLTDIYTACVTLATVALGVLFLEVLLDHLVGLPLFVRRIVLALGLSSAVVYVFSRIVMPIMRRVNGFYAARTIEQTDPSFKNSLINYLDLRRHRAELSKTVMATIEAKAVGDLTKVEVDTVVNQRRLNQMCYAGATVVVVFCFYWLVTPKDISASVRRAFLADESRPTNTQLLNIKPGNEPALAKVVAGTHVPFSVDVSGTRPKRVLLHYSTDGGLFYATAEFAPGRTTTTPWQTTLRNVQQNVDYYLTGGDAESIKYHLEVLPAPMVTSVRLDYDFPAYTGIPRRSNIEGGNVEALEGTRITVHAQTNQPAQTGKLDFGKENTVSMDVTAGDPQQLTGRFKVSETGSYTIKFTTTGGQANPDPVVYDIHALKDEEPKARFVRPSEPSIKAHSNEKVTLVMEASDDFAVKDVTLHVHQGTEILKSINYLEKKPPAHRFRQQDVLDLAAMKVKPGSKIEYWLTVRDTKEPESNKAETSRQVIEVIDPLPERELAMREEKAKQDVPPPGDEEQAMPPPDEVTPTDNNQREQ